MVPITQSNEIFVATGETLENSATVFDRQRQEFMDTMQRIKGFIKPLADDWQGSAAEGFLEQFNKLDANFNAYEGAISEYAKKLREIAPLYAQRQDNIANASRQLDNSKLFQ